MVTQNLYQALREVDGARACLACARRRHDENGQVIATAISHGEDKRVLQLLRNYSLKMQEIHNELLQGKRFQKYEGLEHYLGARKTDDLRELVSELSVYDGEANSIFLRGDLTRIGSSLYWTPREIGKGLGAISLLFPSSLYLGLGISRFFETQNDSLNYLIWGVGALMIPASFFLLDPCTNPHLDFKSHLDKKRVEITDLLTKYSASS
jgi:hypothetical protein